MTNLESARQRWLAEHLDFQAFGEEISGRLQRAIRIEGISAEISSRAKDIDSILKKLIKKPNHTYDSLDDKSGVRVIVRYKHEIEPVVKIACQLLKCADRENKVDSLGPDKMGYLSTHVDVRLLDGDPLVTKYPNDEFRAELQIRTLAQHLWSEISHDAFYKNDETLSPLPPSIKRRVYILAGVLEVADDGFNSLSQDMNTTPEVEILKALEKNFSKLTARRGDPEISLELIRTLSPLYNSTAPQVAVKIEEFFHSHESVLQQIYDRAERLHDRSAFLYQPESLMIYELLETNQAMTRETWNTRFPDQELERIANDFGISFD